MAKRCYVLEAGGVMAGALPTQASYEEVRRVYLGESRCLAQEAL